MQFKKSIFSVIAALLLLGMALLPAIFRGTSRAPLLGPDLESFEYEEVEFIRTSTDDLLVELGTGGPDEPQA